MDYPHMDLKDDIEESVSYIDSAIITIKEAAHDRYLDI